MKKILIVALFSIVVGAIASGCADESGSQDRKSKESLENGITNFKNGDFSEAVPKLEQYLPEGERSACRFVGLAYALGLGVSVDYRKSKEAFDFCADDKGSNYFAVGMELEKRGEKNANSTMALDWYNQAAEYGSKAAATRLAEAYSSGELGLTIDLDRAESWRQRASNL